MPNDQLVDLGLLFDGLLVLQHLLRSLLLGPLVVGLWSEVDDLNVDGLEHRGDNLLLELKRASVRAL